MNIATAWRFMVAAQDDPVLAAWASVCEGYSATVSTEISPYDAWEAYGYLFNHGLISSADYDNTDAKRAFFSGAPNTHEIQEVLERMRFLPEEDAFAPQIEKETEPMSNDPFLKKTNSLTTRGSGQASGGLSARRQSPSLQGAFSTRNEVTAQPRGGSLRSAFGGQERQMPAPRERVGGLACQDEYHPSNEPGKPRIFCGDCNNELHVNVDHREQDIPGDGDRGPLDLVIFFCKCSDCGWVYHSTASRDPHPNEPINY